MTRLAALCVLVAAWPALAWADSMPDKDPKHDIGKQPEPLYGAHGLTAQPCPPGCPQPVLKVRGPCPKQVECTNLPDCPKCPDCVCGPLPAGIVIDPNTFKLDEHGKIVPLPCPEPLCHNTPGTMIVPLPPPDGHEREWCPCTPGQRDNPCPRFHTCQPDGGHFFIPVSLHWLRGGSSELSWQERRYDLAHGDDPRIGLAWGDTWGAGVGIGHRWQSGWAVSLSGVVMNEPDMDATWLRLPRVGRVSRLQAKEGGRTIGGQFTVEIPIGGR